MEQILRLGIDPNQAVQGGNQFIQILDRIAQNGDKTVSGLNRLNDGFNKIGDEGSKAAVGLHSSWSEFVTGFNQSTEVLNKAFGLFKASWHLVEERTEIAELGQVYAVNASSIGRSSDEMMASFREATENTVSDSNLMKSSLLAMRKGATTDMGEMTKLFEIAKAKSHEGFGGTIEIFDQMVDAITTGQKRSLMSLGFLSDSFKKAKDGAEVLMSRTEMIKAIMDQGATSISLVAKAGGSTAEEFDRAIISVSKMKNGLIDGLLPAADRIAKYFNQTLIPEMKRLSAIVREIAEEAGLIETKSINAIKKEMATLTTSQEEKDRIAGNKFSNANSWMPDSVQNLINGGEWDKLQQKETRLRFLQGQLKELESEALTPKLDGSKAVDTLTVSFENAKEKISKTKVELHDLTDSLHFLNISMESAADGVVSYFTKSLGIEGVYGIEKLRDEVISLGEELKTQLDLTAIAKKNTMGLGFSVLGAAAGTSQSVRSKFLMEGEEAYKASKELDEKRVETLKNNMQINVRDAFQNGLYDAMNGGDFFKSFGEALKRSVTNALAAGLTDMIFKGGSGSFDMGSLFSGGGSSSGSSSLLSKGVSSIFGGSSSGNQGSGFSLGNLFKGGSMLSNLGTGLAVGYGVSKLFGEGGLFGSNVVHGQSEATSSASSNAERVKQAQADQKALLTSLIGVSEETRKALSGLQFSTVSVVGHDSGDGIFSKKTTTYETVGGAESESALKMFAELSAKAQAEATRRAFDISMTQLNDPARALDLTIQDLRESINAMGAAAESLPEQLQLAQLEAQKRLELNTKGLNTTNSWLSLALSSGDAQAMEKAKSYVSQGSMPQLVGASARGTPILGNDGQEISKGFSYVSDAYSPYSTDMLNAIDRAHQEDYRIKSLPEDEAAAVIKARDERAMASAQEMMDMTALQMADGTRTLEQRNASFEQWQELDAKYWELKLQQLDNDQKMQDIAKAKQNTLRDDILGTLLTHVGEVETRGSQKVIVISGGQQDGGALAKRLTDADLGLDPELATAVQKIIANLSKTNAGKWG